MTATIADAARIRAAADTLARAWALEFPGRVLTGPAVVVMLAIVRGENSFGEAAGFAGSNNWGAVVCHRHDFPCIKSGDHDANGHPVMASFQAYPSPVEGARGFLRALFRHPVAVPVDTGDPSAVARAMFANGYYTGTAGTADDRIATYAGLITRNAYAVSSVLAVAPLSLSSSNAWLGPAAILFAAAVVGGTLWAFAPSEDES